MGKQWKQWQTLFWGGAPKSLQMVTAIMKLKMLAPWKKSYDQPRQHFKKQRHYFANKSSSSQSYGFSSSHVWMWEWSCSVVSKSLQPQKLQHARPPCPSSTPGVVPNSCPLSRWCHPVISSSVIPFSSCLQSFPASGSFPRNQFFTSGGQSIGVSASASVLQWIFKVDFF